MSFHLLFPSHSFLLSSSFVLVWCGVVVSGVGLINETNQHWACMVSTWIGDHLRAGKASRYVTSHLGQLSLPSLRGR